MAGRAVALRLAVAIASVLGLGITLGCSSSSLQSTAPLDQEVWFAFGLRRDQAGLQEAIDRFAGQSWPRFMSAADVGAKFGPSRSDEQAAIEVLSKVGFEGSPDASGAVMIGTLSVMEAQEFFGVAFDQVVNGDLQMIAPRGSLEVPKHLSGAVTDVFGGYATIPVPVASQSPTRVDCSARPAGSGGWTAARQAYGLPKSGGGKGVTVGLLEVDTYEAQAISDFARCTGNAMPEVSVSSANAVPGQLRQTNAETSLDIVALGLVAPDVAVEVVQYDPNSSIVFALAAVSDVDFLSVSGGFCSEQLSDQEVSIAEWQLLSLAAQGTTSVVAAGDTGSSGCAPQEQLAVMYPSESPNVLSVGGTQFTNKGSSRVWKDSSRKVAGGGGPSGRFRLPAYQHEAGLVGQGRQTPDVAFLADSLQVGAIVVCNPGVRCAWEKVAGTSATAPGVTGGLANVLQVAREQQPGRRFGLLNQALYAAAGRGVAGDVTLGDNDLYGVGCCTAAPGYDMASGWGSLNFKRVRATLAP